MATVHVVIAGVDYEGSAAIAAFEVGADAEAFADKCREYEDTRPHLQSNTSRGAAVWRKKLDAWKAAHPGGEAGEDCDYYNVTEVPFIATTTPKD